MAAGALALEQEIEQTAGVGCINGDDNLAPAVVDGLVDHRAVDHVAGFHQDDIRDEFKVDRAIG